LGAAHYQKLAAVHWSMTIDQRAEGWLDALFHARLREVMAHTLHRYRLLCPAYCLMPDHGHFVWMGTGDASDQLRASGFFRREWNALLGKRMRLQKQAYDHVCREDERGREAFRRACHYVMDNPVRTGLVERFECWPFLGAMAPGYPRLDPRGPAFWDRFWKIYEIETRPARPVAKPLRASKGEGPSLRASSGCPAHPS
jgi:REP element-mobilizing transposase RayT